MPARPRQAATSLLGNHALHLLAVAQGVHAGVPPQWDAAQTLGRAAEVQAMLRGPDLHGFLEAMYGNELARWDDGLAAPDRWRFVINALTRPRFCRDDGTAIGMPTRRGGKASRRSRSSEQVLDRHFAREAEAAHDVRHPG